jgi:hypothetical protein
MHLSSTLLHGGQSCFCYDIKWNKQGWPCCFLFFELHCTYLMLCHSNSWRSCSLRASGENDSWELSLNSLGLAWSLA